MILIIDDDLAVQASLNLLLKQAGFNSIAVGTPQEALKTVNANDISLVLLDMNFSLNTSGEEGLKLLEEIKSLKPAIPVIIITAWGSIDLAVKGMKLGAFDFINKPWDNRHLINSITTALHLNKSNIQEIEFSTNRAELNIKFDFENIIGEDPKFIDVLETVSRVSDTDASILIIGESGTGKEVIAEAIHNNSRRKQNPFVKVNLGGISSSLFESEMFGHKKGSFTDAKENRVGRFEASNSGTIFLDEIGDLDMSSQVKLLRVLQDRSFEVLGSSISKSVDVRVISATNRDLKELIENNEFREDLYYRINLITIKIPPLRERPTDIVLLVRFYINNLKMIYNRDELEVSAEALNWLSELPLPGNTRELKNLVERTVLVSGKNSLDVQDFAGQQQTAPNKNALDSLPPIGSISLEEMELSMIKKALLFYDRNISKAAKSLGLSRSALYRRMEKFGITK